MRRKWESEGHNCRVDKSRFYSFVSAQPRQLIWGAWTSQCCYNKIFCAGHSLVSCLFSLIFIQTTNCPRTGHFTNQVIALVGWSNISTGSRKRGKGPASVGSTSWAAQVYNNHRGTSAQDGSKCWPHCSYGIRECDRTGVARRTHETRWERDLSTDGGTCGFVCCILGTLIQMKHWWLERTNGRLAS